MFSDLIAVYGDKVFPLSIADRDIAKHQCNHMARASTKHSSVLKRVKGTIKYKRHTNPLIKPTTIFLTISALIKFTWQQTKQKAV